MEDFYKEVLNYLKGEESVTASKIQDRFSVDRDKALIVVRKLRKSGIIAVTGKVLGRDILTDDLINLFAHMLASDDELKPLSSEDIVSGIYNDAVKFCFEVGKISLLELQRKYRIGHHVAGMIVSKMVEDGIATEDYKLAITKEEYFKK